MSKELEAIGPFITSLQLKGISAAIEHLKYVSTEGYDISYDESMIVTRYKGVLIVAGPTNITTYAIKKE